MAIRIVRTKHFDKAEKKYLSKLSKPQKEEYARNLRNFTTAEPSAVLSQLWTHALTESLKGFHSFTCLKSGGRSDRVVFEVVVDDSGIDPSLSKAERVAELKKRRAEIRFEDINEALLHDVGDHEVYERMKRSA